MRMFASVLRRIKKNEAQTVRLPFTGPPSLPGDRFLEPGQNTSTACQSTCWESIYFACSLLARSSSCIRECKLGVSSYLSA